MTSGRFQITVTGLIGPNLTRAFPGFASEVVARHHVLLVPDDTEDRLLALLGRLHERGIEVDHVVARTAPPPQWATSVGRPGGTTLGG
jgi:hypothetical protein